MSEVFIPSDGSMEREQARSNARRKARRKARKPKSAEQQWARALRRNLRWMAFRAARFSRDANNKKLDPVYRQWARRKAEAIINGTKKKIDSKDRERFDRYLVRASEGKLPRVKQWDVEMQVEEAYADVCQAARETPTSERKPTFDEVSLSSNMHPRTLRRLVTQLGLPLRKDKVGCPRGTRQKEKRAAR
jgi:hypothetical protein